MIALSLFSGGFVGGACKSEFPAMEWKQNHLCLGVWHRVAFFIHTLLFFIFVNYSHIQTVNTMKWRRQQKPLDMRHLCQDLLKLSIRSFTLLPLTSHWFHYLCHPHDLQHIQSQPVHNKRQVQERLGEQAKRARARSVRCVASNEQTATTKKVFHGYPNHPLPPLPHALSPQNMTHYNVFSRSVFALSALQTAYHSTSGFSLSFHII